MKDHGAINSFSDGALPNADAAEGTLSFAAIGMAPTFTERIEAVEAEVACRKAVAHRADCPAWDLSPCNCEIKPIAFSQQAGAPRQPTLSDAIDPHVIQLLEEMGYANDATSVPITLYSRRWHAIAAILKRAKELGL